MTASPETDRDRVETEAAAWLVRLAEDSDDAGLHGEFEAWRRTSALNAEIWARTSRAYALVGAVPPRHQARWTADAATHEAAAAPPASVRPPASRRRRVALAGLAAAAAACLVAMVPRAMLLIEADYATATAELRSVALSDGTRVQLAPESAIDIAFTDGRRHIRLLKGEAFFDVAPDASRPFQVTAGRTVATVLGTAFDMHLGDGGAAVAVQHGHVRVSDGAASPPVLEELRAGDWVRIGPAGVVRGTMRPEEVADWQRGELVARDRPIGEIVDALRRHYGGVILLRNDAFAQRRVSGIYRLGDPVATLHGLAAAHGATVRQIAPWVLLITAG